MTRNPLIQKQNWAVPLLVDVELGKDWTVPYDLKDIRNGEGHPELVEIFGGEKPPEKPVVDQPSVPDTVEVEKPSVSTYSISALSEDSARAVADWVRSQEGEWDVLYEGRSIKALLV